MIKADKGTVHLEGNGMMIHAELAAIVNGVKDSIIDSGISPDASDEIILGIVEIGLKSKEEIAKEAEEIKKNNDDIREKIGSMLHEIVDSILGSSRKDDE